MTGRHECGCGLAAAQLVGAMPVCGFCLSLTPVQREGRWARTTRARVPPPPPPTPAERQWERHQMRRARVANAVRSQVREEERLESEEMVSRARIGTIKRNRRPVGWSADLPPVPAERLEPTVSPYGSEEWC